MKNNQKFFAVIALVTVIGIAGYSAWTKLNIPPTPYLSYSAYPQPNVVIRVPNDDDEARYKYFNIYRATDLDRKWTKINTNGLYFYRGGESSGYNMDFDFPKDAGTLYYRVTGIDETTGVETLPSRTVSLNINGLIVSEKNNIPLPTQTNTSSWNTYTNTEHGFEFQYPNDRIFKETKGIDGDGVNYFNVNIDTKENMEFTCDGCDGPSTFFMVSRYKPIINSITDTNCSKVRVDEILGNKCVVEDSMNGPTLHIYLTKDGIIYYNMLADNYTGENKALIDKIISTFKFTEPKVQVNTSNWKTYSNDQYGFEFNYPSDYYLGTEAGGYLGSGSSFTSAGQSVTSVSMPVGSYPKNTDFDTAFFKVSVNADLDEQSCKKSYDYQTSGKVLTQTKIINGTLFYQGETGSGGLGHQASDKFFHAYNRGICYELLEGVRTAGFGGADWITEQVDTNDVFNKLDPILYTFKFTK